jgi:hypothetical protein
MLIQKKCEELHQLLPGSVNISGTHRAQGSSLALGHQLKGWGTRERERERERERKRERERESKRAK